MTRMASDASALSAQVLEEYTSIESIRKYSKETAGHGISHLLAHDYGEIYRRVVDDYIPPARRAAGVRLLEFGCGAGMNLLHLVSTLDARGISIDCAYGTDLSAPLIAAANQAARSHLPATRRDRVRFGVATNENLIEGMTQEFSVDASSLFGSFDLVFGVNTIRYCHRLGNADECARTLFALLRDGGVCINIDMNNKFPAFRSRLRDWLTIEERARRLPTLEEYARPFAAAGFEIIEKRNFCWIPHSAGPRLTAIMGGATPILSTIAPTRAMRSLVIARKRQERRS